MIRHYVFLLLMLAPVLVHAQDSASFSRDMKLARHLLSIDDHADALFLLDKYSYSSLKATQADSLYFYKGLGHHLKAPSGNAAAYFDKVAIGSSFYHRSKYLQAFDHLYIRQYDSSKAVLAKINNMGNGQLEELRLLELAGIALLERDHNSFLTHSSKFTYGYPAFTIEQRNLLKYSMELWKVKKRSPAVAGLLSAVIPGSGKLYAGRRAEAAATFFQLALLGGMTYENYKVLGPKSPQFIIFGGLFTVFYAGNIYGSAISVKVKRQELLNEIDNQVVVDLQLPLQRVFK